jgi:hypothetical protein
MAMKTRTHEDTPRVLFIALGLWAIATVAGALEGVFAKLTLVELAALSTFAFAFAIAAAYGDLSLRHYLVRASTRSLLTFIVEVDLGIAIGTMLALGLGQGAWPVALLKFPLAVVIVFALPVAGVAHVLLAERLLRRRPVALRNPVPSR